MQECLLDLILLHIKGQQSVLPHHRDLKNCQLGSTFLNKKHYTELAKNRLNRSTAKFSLNRVGRAHPFLSALTLLLYTLMDPILKFPLHIRQTP